MRLRVEITTGATELPWSAVLKPGRSLAYDLLARTAPELGRRLHEHGWGPHGMVPFGHSAPCFPAAPRRRGAYAVGGRGVLELGSPLPEVVEAWALALKQRELIDWGGAALRIMDVAAGDPPEFSTGRARFRTVTPVVLKGSGRDERGVRTTRQAWLMPNEPEFPAHFAVNLRRKAQTLGLDEDVSLEQISWVGPKRSFAVGGGAKPGAAVEVDLAGAPDTLRAVWDWGLGQANSAGFGWVAA
jgi:CRISPR-associated endoribonuclease Cas6